MKKLYEFSPSELILTFKNGVMPAISHGVNSAKNTFKIAKINSTKNGKSLYTNTIKQLAKSCKSDPTLFGDAVRGSEAARQALSTVILQNLPPLPTADTQSVKQTIEASLNALSRGNNKGKLYNFFRKFGFDANNTSKTMKKALSNPTKSVKDLAVDRATLSTYQDSPITNYSSPLFGISGPIVDNNSIMMSFYQSGLSPQDFIKHLYTYNKSAYYQAKKLLPEMMHNFVNKVKSVGNIIKPKQYSFVG